MRHLRNLIAYFIAKQSLGRTELTKYIYVFEYWHTLAFNQPYSEACFIRYKHGPYCSSIVQSIEEMPDIIAEQTYITYNGYLGYHYHIKRPYENLSGFHLPQPQQLLADSVINVLGDKTLDELLDYVYLTPPMAKVIEAEERDGYLHNGEELDMTVRRPIPQFTVAELEAARQRNRQRKTRGSRNEYVAHLVQEYKAFEPVRRRVNQCLMSGE